MLLYPVDLTTALRPALLPDETLLFVQDAVGLYQGNSKIPEYQNGQVYLTSHRACYVDNAEPREKAVSVILREVERCDLFAGFLKSSPKITLHPKAAKTISLNHGAYQQANGTGDRGHTRSQSSHRYQQSTKTGTATWVCPICTYSNPVAANFDPTTANENTPLSPCLSCGISPPLLHVVKAALAGMVYRKSTEENAKAQKEEASGGAQEFVSRTSRCPRCTFENHSSMNTCEICGASLRNSPPDTLQDQSRRPTTDRPSQSSTNAVVLDVSESIKFSFRSGGERVFLERIRGALIQRKWLLQSAPTVPHGGTTPNQAVVPAASRNIGITGLERRNRDQQRNNEVVIGNAFEDLSALMASAKEIIALAETFAKQTKSSTDSNSYPQQRLGNASETTTLLASLNLTTTRDMLDNSSSEGANSTYLMQLSRQLADFLSDDSSGTAILRSAGGIISVVDLWAIFNRARGGVELVSPTDFADAVALFEKLKLPLQMRTFESGLRVVRSAEWSDERIISALLSWLQQPSIAPFIAEERTRASTGHDWGKGVTALQVADRFGWSVGVASEELLMAEGRGAICREVGIEGLKFWVNHFQGLKPDV